MLKLIYATVIDTKANVLEQNAFIWSAQNWIIGCTNYRCVTSPERDGLVPHEWEQDRYMAKTTYQIRWSHVAKYCDKVWSCAVNGLKISKVIDFRVDFRFQDGGDWFSWAGAREWVIWRHVADRCAVIWRRYESPVEAS